MKARINSRINNVKGSIKKANKVKVKNQLNPVLPRNKAMGYCLHHNIYVNYSWIHKNKKDRCFNCESFIKFKKEEEDGSITRFNTK